MYDIIAALELFVVVFYFDTINLIKLVAWLLAQLKYHISDLVKCFESFNSDHHDTAPFVTARKSDNT